MRKSDHPILPLILNRWSPRSMTGEKLRSEDLQKKEVPSTRKKLSEILMVGKFR